MSENIRTLVTHSARFHSDDVFACATLLLLYPAAQVVRSRDEAVIAKGDVVFDVGNVYDADRLRFDHHQAGGAGVRANKIPYASFGLVWKHFGKSLTGSQEIADKIDERLVQSIDAMDNGIDLYTVKIPGIQPFIFQNLTFLFGATWKENDSVFDEHFMEVVNFAKKIIEREIKQTADLYEGESFVREAYERMTDKRIVILDRNYPWGEFLSHTPEPLYVVRPNVQDPHWKVEAVKNDIFSYENRKMLPAAWAGRRDEELSQITGVPGSVFCHNARFLAVAKTKDAALRLAQIAVDA